MNDFLSNMKSFVLYQQITKLSNEKNKNKSNNLEDDLQLEMIKFKKAISSSPTPIKIKNLNYKDYSSITSQISSTVINANENIKDTLGKDSGLQSLVSKASSQSNVANGSSSTQSAGSSSLNNYSSTFSFSSSNPAPIIKQFGLVKMTGTEGSLKNGYTIGKEAKQRASASINYVTRDENGKSIADLKDKNGNTLSKVEANEQIRNIEAERRLVLSPNPKLNISEEELDKVVRETMSSYAKSFGKEFNYFYAIHNNTKTPHAHILMTSNHPDGDGIKMYKDELFELKMNFEDKLKELIKDSGINIKDESTMPTSRQIANFIGAIPDTSLFLQNKFLAEKISKKFDLGFNSKDIGNNPEKLENWFLKNDKSYKEYFMSATNKDAFLFQDYIKTAEGLSQKYDLGLTKTTTTNIKDFKNWLEEKQEIFLANRIAQDKNIILQKDDVSDKNKLYKWFKENESDVKEWNEKYKYFPSKQMSSLAQKYSNMVDIKPDNILESRKETRDFVKNYTRNPLIYAGDSRKSLYEVLEVKKEQYKNEFSKKNITKKSFDTELERISTLQKRLIQSQEITESSLKRYNLDTNIYSTDSKTIQIDGINFLASENTKELLTNKINSHVENLTKGHTDEYSKNYIKKATALNYIISKSDNISISALENIGLKKEKDLQDFKIEKVDTELKIINFKNTDLNNDKDDIKSAEDINKDRPLTHQVAELTKIQKDFKLNTENLSYKEANNFINENKNFNSYNKKELTEIIKNIKTHNIKLRGNNIFLNKYIDTINENLDKLNQKLETGKNTLSLDEVKSTGIDIKNLEIYQGTIKTNTISNDEENLKNIDYLVKGYSNKKEYEDFIKEIKNGNISKLNLNNALAKATSNNNNIKVLPIDLKKNITENIKFEPKEITQELVKIDSLKNIKINETVSNAIFNSPKFFENIANRLQNEHGIEIKTAKDLSDNFDKIGKSSDLRNLITKTIQHKINNFRQENNIQNERDFNKYIEKINLDKQSKIPLDSKQKELNSLNSFLTKNEGKYPIFISDLQKIGANTINFTDKEKVNIKVEVVPVTTENKSQVLSTFDSMIFDSERKIENIKINEIDKNNIDDINEKEKIKSNFKEATNEYIKTSINPKETINYVSSIIDNKTLNGMSYMISKGKIEDIPKNFLEARNIDTSNFEIIQKDKEVETVAIGSKNNFEQFKEFLMNNNLENILNETTQTPVIENVDYKTETNTFISSNQEINNSNINEFHTLLSLAIEDKNIEVMDSLYKLDSEYKDDLNLLELKFVSYAEALNISKDDVYTKMLEKYFNLNNEEIKSLDNLEKAFDTYFELSGEEKENLSLADLKHQLYAENLVELVTNEYEHYMWKYFDMDNENVSEDNMKAYFEATQNLTDEALKLNDLISQNLEIKQLQNEIEELLENGNFKQAQELMQDERLENTTRNFFEYIYESMLNDENVLDEVYEKVINNINLEEKTYETFKQDFLEEMKKIDLEGELMNEILEEMKQQELEEYELTLGGE
ncbi:hypothetical protein N5U20_00695 [Aliarcobacter butzleri]|uniref:relaxase/mobilization nuclease domain-containing protein n=1 Tax=Aliarcobacter butzleri TaxID=28197 RepID=UPI0021B4BCA2|nr:hypothetical protein [Aliarcobacter butzleri]MCT7611717.1 hypothetical protein [Aliarcobacter butzleri]MCT7640288.1 hypothetical protein [Aliarcobacter butzleri]